MGGIGSGRPRGSGRNIVEAFNSLDVNRLRRTGCLEPGWIGILQWTSSIILYAEPDRLNLIYQQHVPGGGWERVKLTVRIVRIACRFGGERPYFICPGCARRVVKLYGVGRYFLCRNCHQLAYASQSETKLHRALRRANKIKQQLGGDAGITAPFPSKPKHMRWQTYERLYERALEAETLARSDLALLGARVLTRFKGRQNNIRKIKYA